MVLMVGLLLLGTPADMTAGQLSHVLDEIRVVRTRFSLFLVTNETFCMGQVRYILFRHGL